ncbi:MAG: PQQ-binding-like beta-propeller repeat protein [Vicinamibacterales bacterium]|nr:PQQ-binding-like beta-propeller repeat protein [Vicinamibacterales bacterium]
MLVALAVVASLGAGPRSAEERAEDPAPLFPLEAAWTLALLSPPVSGPAIDARHAYVALKDGSIEAADLASGERVWSVEGHATVAPVVSGDLVLLAGSAQIAALTTENGDPVWTRPLPDPAVALAATGELVLVATMEGRLVALSVSDGIERWRQQLPGRVTPPMLVTPGRVSIADEAGHVTVVETATGQVRWHRRLDGRLSPPAGTGDRLFVGSSTNAFWALRASDGATLWRWRMGGDVAGAVVEGDRVYVVTLDNLIRALDAGSGNQRWKASLSTRPGAPPLALKGLAVVSGVAPRLEGFSRRTGASVGVLAPVSELAGSPALTPALVPYRTALVVATRDGQLLGFRPERLMLRDPKTAPLTTLPGRLLAPERLGLARE